ncbi:sigma-B regulation protein RsbU (phosphoserine phosphatase) [Lentibacillus halodurans]|uniref:Sigma-B regulation protein RsbU (Phosphoserine phosphatase) n=1 Tax=Lentibacillus halodurans TaxID=237679 RepID=A0A1I1ALI5_9BACI|nr:PP2C family protein-serine/threonine phosphatase [Lentibacillus halodurans]SFB38901.1 sigma-B regulation protein RsbU (phosphoserine phosphatase) [Lentibacillus halodurans]
METLNTDISNYRNLLKHYIEIRDEQSLYGAEQLSKAFIKDNVPPEEIINLHIQALSELYPDIPEYLQYSMNFLLEIMISYGVAHQEFQTLREEQSELKSEIAVAANMQDTLLATTEPDVDGLDIGVISVPAHQMSGDYYHFVMGEDGSFGIAVADVIGKGIPAALCMSMIKYSMDSLPKATMSPKTILKNLNRVVERNVDASMFITMFYTQYIPAESKIRYSSAGHEPGFYYNARSKTFEEIKTKGLVLGVSPDADYREYERTIYKDDMIILLTDGVTECRQGDRFIETEEVLEVIGQYTDLPAQEMVNKVYKHFERMQNFRFRDDFTLIVLRKEV